METQDRNPPEASDTLLSIPALANLLGVSVSSIYRLLAREQSLRPVKIGARTLVRRSDVDSYLAGR